MKELVIDAFAGGGGASTGIRMALGRDADTLSARTISVCGVSSQVLQRVIAFAQDGRKHWRAKAIAPFCLDLPLCRQSALPPFGVQWKLGGGHRKKFSGSLLNPHVSVQWDGASSMLKCEALSLIVGIVESRS